MGQDASGSVEWSDCHHWGDTPCYLLNNEKWQTMSIFQKSKKKRFTELQGWSALPQLLPNLQSKPFQKRFPGSWSAII